MGRRGGVSISALAIVLLSAALLAGCGDEKRYSDDRIIEAVHLEPISHTEDYGIDGDPFCPISKELLNDSDEVEDAVDAEEGVVVASGEGNVGVVSTGPFGRDCERKARRRLNELDPEPKEE